jgi:Smg protein
MKDNLFEMLLSLFEKTLSKLKETHTSHPQSGLGKSMDSTALSQVDSSQLTSFIKPARLGSMRVFTATEQNKLSKSSYQFLVRAVVWGILSPESMELILNQLLFSESPCVPLQETKWTIRTLLAERLDTAQLAFLDLVLYHKEDAWPLH